MTNGNDPKLITDFERLREACIDLRTLSYEFRRLFSDADKPDLDEIGAAVFPVIHGCMIEAWWLRVGRLFDPAASSGRKNLSIRNICDRLESVVGVDPSIVQVDQALEAIWVKMKTARNRHVAHNDLKASRLGNWLGSLSAGDDEALESHLQVLCDQDRQQAWGRPLEPQLKWLCG